ncbi:MAG: PEP-CTERM-box response regulator transcription factor [Acidobacteriota bacterium]
MTLPKLLVVEDDEAVRLQLKHALQGEFTLSFAEDRLQARAAMESAAPEVVLLDLGLPPSADTPVEGLKALEELLGAAPRTRVIVLTGNTDREHALRAIQLGAFDYHLKPVEIDPLRVVLQRGAYLQGLEEESDSWLRAQEEAIRFEEILGTTAAMREIFSMIQRVAKTDATILIEGDSGTGKELIARAIHQRSRRQGRQFIPINCGAIPETLLEAELFGHEKGAFTGAHVQRKGRFELADRGTLFLDEIGELSLLLQVKLLRFLQERTIERVGGRELISLNLRIIAATNRDLKAQLERGLFREDLYYRLSVVKIQVPPLRERGEDVIVLANAFLRRSCQEHRRKVRFTQDALRALLAYPWPGNIRELENKVQRAVIMARGPLVEPADLDLEPSPTPGESAGLREARDRAEREALLEALIRNRGNISRAAKDMRVSRPTFHGLLDKHQISAKQFR